MSERFFSAENARSSTGLGLSAAKTLTRQMNGAIAAEYSGGVLCVRPAFPEAAGNRRGGQQRADKKWGRWQTKPPLANKAAKEPLSVDNIIANEPKKGPPVIASSCDRGPFIPMPGFYKKSSYSACLRLAGRSVLPLPLRERHWKAVLLQADFTLKIISRHRSITMLSGVFSQFCLYGRRVCAYNPDWGPGLDGPHGYAAHFSISSPGLRAFFIVKIRFFARNIEGNTRQH